MATLTLVNAKSENQEALNIILESGSSTDRSFPGVGTGSIGDIKVTIALVGYNTESASNSTTVDDKLIWGTFGSGISSREKNDLSLSIQNQGEGVVLLSLAGFLKNTEALWTALSSTLKLEAYAPSTLVDMYAKTQTRIHRVFFVDDLKQTEPFVSLFLPLLTKIN